MCACVRGSGGMCVGGVQARCGEVCGVVGRLGESLVCVYLADGQAVLAYMARGPQRSREARRTAAAGLSAGLGAVEGWGGAGDGTRRERRWDRMGEKGDGMGWERKAMGWGEEGGQGVAGAKGGGGAGREGGAPEPSKSKMLERQREHQISGQVEQPSGMLRPAQSGEGQ